MDLGLRNKVAVISGGSKGIGFATALILAREGAKIVLAARTRAPLDEAVARLNEIAPDAAIGVCGDMTELANVRALLTETRRVFGQVDIAISNAGALETDPAEGHAPGHFLETPPAEFARKFRQLSLTAWYLAREAMPEMRARRWGRILNINSSSAREPKWQLPHVLPNTLRPAVAGMHRSLARRMYRHGITVHNILTGNIATERWRDYHAWLAGKCGISFDELVAERCKATPLGRPGTPHEIASYIVFLCSPLAGSITGQSVPITGGRSAHIY
jgi:3-oxoacyl-[acyl-carrier protein] reductase